MANGPGRKFDSFGKPGQKPRWDLIPFDVLEEVVKVYTTGSEKYDPNNWQNVEEARRRYFGAAMRHLTARFRGEIFDEGEGGTGHRHLAQVIWNFMTLLWLELHENDPKGQSDSQQEFLSKERPTLEKIVETESIDFVKGLEKFPFYFPYGWDLPSPKFYEANNTNVKEEE